MAETLNGFIERVTYHNPENGFAVLRVKVKGRDDLISVIGSTTSVTVGVCTVISQTRESLIVEKSYRCRRLNR